MSTVASVAGHDPGVSGFGDERNSARAGSTRGLRHFASSDRQLSFFTRPFAPTGEFPVHAQPCDQTPDRWADRALFFGAENRMALCRRGSGGCALASSLLQVVL